MRETSRREFVRVAAATGAVVAAGPALGSVAESERAVLGFLGLAHIHTPSFIRQLLERPDVRVKWAWDPDPRKVAVRAPELQARTGSLEEILADPEVQGVVVCSETNRHLELVTAAARARKHLFVEKPLGMTAAESRSMAAAIEQAGVLFTTGYFLRTDPMVLFLREQIGQGAFGTITRVSAANCHGGSLGGWFDERPDAPAESWRWMADPQISGVGGFGDLGTHSLDILMWLCGPIAAVSAEIRSVTGRYGDCDEAGTALVRFASGVTGTLSAGWVDLANPIALQVAGTEGHAMIVNDSLYFQSNTVAGSKIGQPYRGGVPERPEGPLQQFVEAVRGVTGHPLVPAREAAERVVVMEAMYRASRERRWVALD